MIERYQAFVGFLIGAILTLFVVVVIALFPGGLFRLANSVLLLVSIVPYYLLLIIVAYITARILRPAPGLLFLIAVLYFLATCFGIWFGFPIVTLAFLAFPPGLVALVLALEVLALHFIPHAILVFLGYVNAASNCNNSPTPTPEELYHRGFLVGLNAWMNLAFAAAIYPLVFFQLLSWLGGAIGFAALGWVGLAVGIILAIILSIATLMCVVQPADTSFQGFIGWTTWLMPMSWLVVGLGWILFYLNLIGHALFSWIPGGFGTFFSVVSVKYRDDFGSIVTIGGVCSNLNAIDTAYNMGTFIFVDYVMGTDEPTELHESGHQLSLCAFGGHFHFIGWFDEMFLGRGWAAYSERLAEGHVPATTHLNLDMW